METVCIVTNMLKVINNIQLPPKLIILWVNRDKIRKSFMDRCKLHLLAVTTSKLI